VQRGSPFVYRLPQPSRKLLQRLTHSILIGVGVERVIGDHFAALHRLEKSVVQFPCEASSLC
jgi:hypothetical protein